MTQNDFYDLVESNENIEWSYNDEDDYFLFRNTDLPYYVNNPEAATKVEGKMLRTLSKEELLAAINKGLEVEQITRITGYFTKISQWNKGKLGELKDRHKEGL